MKIVSTKLEYVTFLHGVNKSKRVNEIVMPHSR